MIDPVAFSVFGWPVHWYGIMWAVGFIVFYQFAHFHGARVLGKEQIAADIDALLLYCGLGALIGGRLGYVLFYGRGLYSDDYLEIFRIWNGGMSFHGGVIGVWLGVIFASRVRKIEWPRMGDLVCLCAPLGVGCGRIGNFINGELWGRPTDVPWGMVFARADDQLRHPSQIYELFAEGIILYLLLVLILQLKPRPGVIAASCIGLGAIARFIVEFFREPDAHIGTLWLNLSTGQWLSFATFAAAAALAAYVFRNGKLFGFSAPAHVKGKAKNKGSKASNS